MRHLRTPGAGRPRGGAALLTALAALLTALVSVLTAFPAPLLAVGLAAQPQGPSRGPTPLDKLHMAYQQKRMQIVRSRGGPEAIRKLTEKFMADLEQFLGSAKGMDRFNGRLMLVDYLLGNGKKEKAITTLRAFDRAGSPALMLAAAAEFAGHLELTEDRDAFIAAALAKKESFEDRMRLGMQLMTRLQEVEKGEKVFADAFASAKNDEQRAKVRWYQSAATREREDLVDPNSRPYEEALGQLAKSFPDTYYGGVARDRLRAMRFRVGSTAIPFQGKDIGGKPIRLADYAGKVVLLSFWASWSDPCRRSAPDMRRMYDSYSAKGLEVIGISLDESVEDAKRAISEDGLPWRQVCDGRGFQADIALRYNVEDPAAMVLIGRDGKIAALHIFPFGKQGVEDARKAIEKALGTD